ncbi:MAG TPA: LysM peptidoglycan-binding domain-containing protein [Smithellaceae bacterium]
MKENITQTHFSEKAKEPVLMIRIKRYCVVYTIVLSLIFALPLFSFALGKKPASTVDKENTIPTTKKADDSLKEESKDDGSKNGNNLPIVNPGELLSSPIKTKQDQEREEKQDKMEKVLDLLKVADNYWEKEDVENTINTLDKAYALILDAGGDVVIARQKDDLRLLISKRLLSVYSAKQTTTNGKASEIPLITNEAVEREIRSFQGVERDFFIAAYQRSGMYRPVIIKELKKARIPEELSWLPFVESGFKIKALSRARALGLWQFIPSTGYKYGLSRDEWVDERMDVEKSTQAAIAYLKELHDMFGDWLTVLAAYNCGEGKVLRVISLQHINYFDRFWDLYNLLPRETSRYVPRFLATLHIIKNPQKYGFDLSNTEKPIPVETVKVNKIMKLEEIASRIEIPDEKLYLINSELRYKMTPDREYDLKIPKESLAKFNLVANEIPESEKPRFLLARTDFIRHRVRSGESLNSIASKYGVPASRIVSYNRLNPQKGLVAGKRLTIPIFKERRYAKGKSRQKNNKIQITSAGRYKVRKGDTLQMIALRSGTTETQIKELNNLQKDTIRSGQILKIFPKENNSNSEEKNDNNRGGTKLVQKSNINMLSASDLDKFGTNKYIVTKGDNLYSISKKNNINVAKLKELNNLSGDGKIIPGQILVVK